MQEAEVVLARLGAAFADQPHDLVVEGQIKASPDRVAWVEGLLARGLERLGPEDLDLLLFRAISTVGGVATFKYALSRFLAVMILAPRYGERSTSDAFVILSKLEHAGFDRWPHEEQRTLIEALELWADRRLITDPQDQEADDIRRWVNDRRHLV